MDAMTKILDMLQSTDEEVRLQALRQIRCEGSLPLATLFQVMGDASWRMRKEAVELFFSLPDAARHTPEVIAQLYAPDNAGLRNAAVDVLVRLGRMAVPTLVQELFCDDHDVRKFVLDILGAIGDVTTVPVLLKALKDPDANVRAAAAENLGKIGSDAALSGLLDALSDPDISFRFTILEALARIGAPVPVARMLPFLEERLLRQALFECFGDLGGCEALPVLVDGLTDSMPNVRRAALLALERFGRRFPQELAAYLPQLAGSAAADALAAFLADGKLEQQRAAIHLLGMVRDGRFALTLLNLLASEELQQEAVVALVALGSEAICSLQSEWADGDDLLRMYLAYVFGEARCHQAAGLLIDGLTSGDGGLQQVAAEAIGKIGSAEGIAPLIATLSTGGEEARDAVIEALCRLGQSHRRAVLAALLPLLEAADAELRMIAVATLGRLGGGEVTPALERGLKDPSPLVRRAAVRSLAETARSGLGLALRLALTDEDAEVRQLATEALGATGDADAVPALGLALQDENIWVRTAAVRSLGRLGGDEATALMATALRDPVGLVAIAALESLAILEGDLVYPRLIEALSHADEEVVKLALRLLTESGRSDWVLDQTDPLLNHRHWEVRLGMARALAALGGQVREALLAERLKVESESLVQEQIRGLLEQFAAGNE